MRFLIGGAGCAGLMAARELTGAGHDVLILEARDRIGGRILPLDAQAFGYPAEGGAEFVHGAAPVTQALVREAGLTLVPTEGQGWYSENGRLTHRDWSIPDEDLLIARLKALETDIPVREFLDRDFPAPRFEVMRNRILRMTEGYEAADPARASSFTLRDFWTDDDTSQARLAEGYGVLLDFISRGLDIRFGAEIVSISERGVACADGRQFESDAVILTLPLPLLRKMKLGPDIDANLDKLGFGDVVKWVFRFKTRFWPEDLSFLFAETPVPTWWSQAPRRDAALCGWLGGPRAAGLKTQSEAELIALGIDSLEQALGVKGDLVAARAIHWGQDPFSRGAYSYATPETKAAQARLLEPIAGRIFLAGEAFFTDGELGTVEAALVSGQTTARRVIEPAGMKRNG